MATDSLSLSRLNELHPKVRDKAIEAYTEACRVTPVGVHPFITEAYRSFERSDALYAQGRTTKGSIVTNAKGGSSLHNYRLAVDFCLQVNGKTSWVVDKNWMKVIEVFKKYGFKSGIDFKSIVDAPHLEMTFGYSVKQLLAKYKAKDFIKGTNYLNL